MSFARRKEDATSAKLDPSEAKRQMVQRSIDSVSKAITDVVCMSCNEEFRAAVLQSMQVKDTVDLKTALRHKLKEISKNRHQWIWASPVDSLLKETDRNKMPSVVNTSKQNEGGDKLHVVQQPAESSKLADFQSLTEIGTTSDQSKIASGVADISGVAQNIVSVPEPAYAVGRLKVDFLGGSKELTKGISGIADVAACMSLVSVGSFVPVKQQEILLSEEEEETIEDKQTTPDIVEITKGMQEVSPFQELAIDEELELCFSDGHNIEDPCVFSHHDQIVPEAYSQKAPRAVQTNSEMNSWAESNEFSDRAYSSRSGSGRINRITSNDPFQTSSQPNLGNDSNCRKLKTYSQPQFFDDINRSQEAFLKQKNKPVVSYDVNHCDYRKILKTRNASTGDFSCQQSNVGHERSANSLTVHSQEKKSKYCFSTDYKQCSIDEIHSHVKENNTKAASETWFQDILEDVDDWFDD